MQLELFDNEIPYFIKVRGCINCGASISKKEKTGREYGYHHELMVACLLRGCFDYGHDLTRPFLDPGEVPTFLEKIKDNPKAIENARKYCLQIKKRFGEYYLRLGVSIDNIIETLPTS